MKSELTTSNNNLPDESLAKSFKNINRRYYQLLLGGVLSGSVTAILVLMYMNHIHSTPSSQMIMLIVTIGTCVALFAQPVSKQSKLRNELIDRIVQTDDIELIMPILALCHDGSVGPSQVAKICDTLLRLLGSAIMDFRSPRLTPKCIESLHKELYMRFETIAAISTLSATDSEKVDNIASQSAVFYQVHIAIVNLFGRFGGPEELRCIESIAKRSPVHFLDRELVNAANHAQQEILARYERQNVGKYLSHASRYNGIEMTLLRPAGYVETNESILLRPSDGSSYV